ncbi:MAG: hypothetical protein RQ736_13385 [Thiogranum sp.]|nr:hypothetical protein [Thiogranum sp.]
MTKLSPLPLQFRILGQQVAVQCTDQRLSDLVHANYAAFSEAADSPAIEYTVKRLAAGGFSIARDGEVLHSETDDDATEYLVVYLLEKLITLELQKLRTDLYFVHSSALERRGRVTMIVADSGTGKSTTAWALLQHGFRYLSDEMAPVDPVRLEIHPYPHAVCLKALPPGPYPLPDQTVQTERTLHVPVASLPSLPIREPKPLQALLFLQRNKPRSVPTYTELSPAEAGARLYANTLNALAHQGHGLQTAIRIASAVPAYILHAGELQATCELIAEIDDNLHRISCSQSPEPGSVVQW